VRGGRPPNCVAVASLHGLVGAWFRVRPAFSGALVGVWGLRRFVYGGLRDRRGLRLPAVASVDGVRASSGVTRVWDDVGGSGAAGMDAGRETGQHDRGLEAGRSRRCPPRTQSVHGTGEKNVTAAGCRREAGRAVEASDKTR
jgi:hypothetical protein